MKKLSVFVNEHVVFEYDRDITFEEQQLTFIDKMENDMARGIKIRGELITYPDSQQCATFIVMNLIKALQQENGASIAASCAYLVNRHPTLVEVHANDHEDSINIEFIDE